MTDRSASMPVGGVPQAPFSEELLADLHADALDPAISAELWPLVRADPQAEAYITELEAVTRLLGTLDTGEQPNDAIPPAVAARVHAALRGHVADTAPTAPVVPLRRTRAAWALAAAAVIAVAFVVVFVVARSDEPSENIVAHTVTNASPTPDSDSGTASLLALVGATDLGPLEDPVTLAGCLRANGVDESRKVLGSGQVRIDGVPATVLLLSGRVPRQITALTVGTACSADSPDTVSVTDIGG
ncbi:hypothetical protein ABH922_004715 [Rhodococcus sp. 27YEA15]|uniref:hypothetical protein n=1 Tax=Rhodococcus sp. 27YEA15 TaxID=3156259 RepID=UPI003C79837F